MLAKKNTEKAIALLKQGNLLNLIRYVPEVADEIVVHAHTHHRAIALFDDFFPN